MLRPRSQYLPNWLVLFLAASLCVCFPGCTRQEDSETVCKKHIVCIRDDVVLYLMEAKERGSLVEVSGGSPLLSLVRNIPSTSRGMQPLPAGFLVCPASKDFRAGVDYANMTDNDVSYDCWPIEDLLQVEMACNGQWDPVMIWEKRPNHHGKRFAVFGVDFVIRLVDDTDFRLEWDRTQKFISGLKRGDHHSEPKGKPGHP